MNLLELIYLGSKEFKTHVHKRVRIFSPCKCLSFNPQLFENRCSFRKEQQELLLRSTKLRKQKMQNSNFSLLNSAKLCFKVLKCGKIVSLDVIHSHKIVDVNCVFPPLVLAPAFRFILFFYIYFRLPEKETQYGKKIKF